MSEESFVIDVNDANFQEQVIAQSNSVPVLLDLWAPWCGPCKTLGPMLDKLAAEYAGRFILAKVNVDESPQVAMALRVQSIPTLYLFKAGQPVDGLQGAQPESSLRALLDRHVPAPKADALTEAQLAFEAGRNEDAADLFKAVLAEKPKSGAALLGMARIALKASDVSAAQSWVDAIGEEEPEYFAAQKLRGVFGFSAYAGDLESLRAQVDANPRDVEAWYSLGASLAIDGRFEDALAAFLCVVEIDRTYRDDAGRLGLLSLFELLGSEDALVVSARRRLAGLLF